MKVRRRAGSIFLAGLVTALLASAAFAGSACAGPAWKFKGKALEGTETIVGKALASSLTVPGLTTKCEEFLYKMKISNSAGTGKGEIAGLTFSECSTNSKFCTVEAIAAERLPWPLHLTTLLSNSYVIIEGIKVTIVYGGEECVLGGTAATITGSAGGLFNNVESTITFSSSTFKTTKTGLKAFGGTVEWNGIFTTEATGAHAGEALEA